MSSNGTRKQTQAFETTEKTASGRLFNITTDDVAIEEVPYSGPTVVNTPLMPPPMPSAADAANEQARARRDSDAMAALNRPRVRKSTLEKFNDEMSLLDRPIEGDVEYVDEPPPKPRMRGVALFAGVVIGLGMGGGVVLSRRHAAPPTIAQASQPAAAAPVAAAPPAAPAVEAAPVLAAQLPAAPAAAAAPAPEAAGAPVAEEEDSAPEVDDGAAAAAPTRGAWDKVKAKAGHGKHASGKSAHHSSKRSVAAKHGSSRRH